MLTIYAIPISLYCAKLRILLRNKGIQWHELPPPGGYGSDEYKRIVPSGNLPAMDDGGLIIGDSEAIAEYFEEIYPDPPMLPVNPADRALVRQRSRFHDTRLEPEVRKLFAHIAPASRDVAVATAQTAAISARLAQLSRLLETHSLTEPDALSLADCGYPVTFTWIELLDPVFGLDIDWPQAISDYRERIGQVAAVHDELASYRPALEKWIAGRITA